MRLNRPGWSKVPEVITALFWIVKVLTTAQGEATSDYFVHAINPYLAVVGAGIVFLGVMALQLRVHRYVAGIYWLAVTMVAIFGTMCADALHIQLGVPYWASTVGFAIAVAVIFWAWHRTEGTLSIHSIVTPRRELFYWAAVLATFALGTAWGDLMAFTLGLGFLTAGIVFAVVIAVPALAHRFAAMNSVLAFWFAYVITRPLGASFADWMGFPRSAGALGWGHGTVSIGFTLLIIGCVAYLSASRIDRAPEPSHQAPGRTPAATGEPALASTDRQ
ncbi:MAG TPA: hypothetical protein VEK76_11025 [Candidatus Binatia bacterium]|nr:hypothetical protein [Candidatus Binatia bacterium]